ncbi:MAG: NUDIX domain-containing protein [Bacteroidota bacterium]|jgi:8-oxo-dGTP diphosphatase
MAYVRKSFNVRVYGLLFKDDSVLLSDELIVGKQITKFPGGGIEFGEGTKECIVREFKEEVGLEVEIKEHFYTTDFFVASAYNPNAQLISIYYIVESERVSEIVTTNRKFDFSEKKNGAQSFRWKPISQLTEKDLTFVVDKKVAEMLRELNSR